MAFGYAMGDRIVTIEPHPICVRYARTSGLVLIFELPALLSFDPARPIQSVERALYGGATAVDFGRHFHLATHAPTEFIEVTPEQAQHLKIARLQRLVGNGTGRND